MLWQSLLIKSTSRPLSRSMVQLIELVAELHQETEYTTLVIFERRSSNNMTVVDMYVAKADQNSKAEITIL